MQLRLLLGLGLCTLCVPLSAQWAVVDVGAIEQLTSQVRQGAQQLQTAKSQYDHLKAMATRAVGLWRYRSPENIWDAIEYADQYATLGAWAQSSITGEPTKAREAYAATTVAQKADDFLGKINAGLSSSKKALYSTGAVMDGNNLAAMRAVGQIRKASADYRNAIKALEDDAQKDDELTQSELAVQQRTSNAQIVELRQNQDTNQLLSAMLDNMVAQAKLQRDSIATSTNSSLEAQQSELDYQRFTKGAGDSLMKWNWSK